MRAAGPFVALLLAACSSPQSPIRSETAVLIADTDDVVSVEGDTESIGSGLASDSMSMPETLPSFPRSCFAREMLARDVLVGSGSDLYHLHGCGRTPAHGDVKVRWQVRALVLHVEMETHGLTIGHAIIDNGTIVSDASASGQDRTMTWQAHFDGYVHTDTTPRKFSRDTQKTLRWTMGVSCVTTDGSSTGTLDSASVRVTMTGLRLCAGEPCPAPQSRVRIDNLVTNKFVEIRFAPDEHAVLTDTSGRSLPITPACARRN